MLRYLVWGLMKALLLLAGPCLMMLGTIIGLKFMWFLLKRKLRQLDRMAESDQ